MFMNQYKSAKEYTKVTSLSVLFCVQYFKLDTCKCDSFTSKITWSACEKHTSLGRPPKQN